MGRRALPKLDSTLDLSRHVRSLDELPQPWDAATLFAAADAPLEVEVGSGKGLFLQSAATALAGLLALVTPVDEATPDHTFFCRVRQDLGARRMGQAFKNIMHNAEEKGIVRKVFTFVDATAIKTKETTWQERDKALTQGEESLNNKNVGNYSADKDARFGCKGKSKF